MFIIPFGSEHKKCTAAAAISMFYIAHTSLDLGFTMRIEDGDMKNFQASTAWICILVITRCVRI
jgi:hypothetical protein